MKLNILGIQVLRFGFIGLASNLVLYFLYLGLTNIGVGYKFAMSLVYIVGVFQTFIFNKKWTFNNHGDLSVTFMRYVILYGVGYLINLGILILGVDQFGYPHQWVQGGVIVFLAGFLFLMQKLWVFKPVKSI